MATEKNKKRRRKNGGFRIPITIAGPMLYVANKVKDDYTAGGMDRALRFGMMSFIGLDVADGKFKSVSLRHGLYPLLAGMLVHKGANALGLNRAIAKSGLPWIRI